MWSTLPQYSYNFYIYFLPEAVLFTKMFHLLEVLISVWHSNCTYTGSNHYIPLFRYNYTFSSFSCMRILFLFRYILIESRQPNLCKVYVELLISLVYRKWKDYSGKNLYLIYNFLCRVFIMLRAINNSRVK